eukprot:scaffold20202_cov52-Phaeocystis_antarctica.AAC.1
MTTRLVGPRAQPTIRTPWPLRPDLSSQRWRPHALYTHSLSPSRPPNNTLNTQSRAQQTHSRSRSLRAHPHSADPPSVMPSAARLGRRSWVGRHRQAERLGHLLRGRVLHRHREALRRERHEGPRRPRRLV